MVEIQTMKANIPKRNFYKMYKFFSEQLITIRIVLGVMNWNGQLVPYLIQNK